MCIKENIYSDLKSVRELFMFDCINVLTKIDESTNDSIWYSHCIFSL